MPDNSYYHIIRNRLLLAACPISGSAQHSNSGPIPRAKIGVESTLTHRRLG